jgi:uncharacterized protein (TIGR02453 family)
MPRISLDEIPAREDSTLAKTQKTPIFSPATFRFFRDLARNNRKPWMDANRDRYRAEVVEPFRRLLDRLAPAVLRLSPAFETGGRTGKNFSRINRDIRFAADKSPYRPHFYLFFSERAEEGRGGGQLYVGLAADAVTSGFRIYFGGRDGTLARIGVPRARENAPWLARQKRRLGKRYDSYWYSSHKGEWTRHAGWPLAPDDWKRLKGWIVRRKFRPAAATRPAFARDVTRIFRELYPLYRFTSAADWKP